MKRRNILYARGLAVLIMLIAVLLEMNIIQMRELSPYTFWLAVVSFGLLLLSTR
jgi:hypothetical protein